MASFRARFGKIWRGPQNWPNDNARVVPRKMFSRTFSGEESPSGKGGRGGADECGTCQVRVLGYQSELKFEKHKNKALNTQQKEKINTIDTKNLQLTFGSNWELRDHLV